MSNNFNHQQKFFEFVFFRNFFHMTITYYYASTFKFNSTENLNEIKKGLYVSRYGEKINVLNLD